MEKNKILEVAKKEKNRGQEYEYTVLQQSTVVAIIIAVLLSVILFFMEYFVRKTVNIGGISVGLIFLCIQMLVEGITLKKKKLIMGGAILSFFTVILLVAHIVQVVS